MGKTRCFIIKFYLTVEEGKPLSHKNIGWERFTDTIIKKVNSRKETVIFVLWEITQRKKRLITNEKHIIIEGVHPSPLSASRGF